MRPVTPLVQFNHSQSEALLQQMPPIHFDLGQDCAWTSSPEVQTYLDFYGINFAKEIPDLIHGFGAMDACSFRIATQYWLPSNPKGTLVVVHGYYDHVGIFSNAIEFGLQQGLAVLAFDMPGHGLSSGERVAIDSFDQYADVLDAVFSAAKNLLPSPYFALGQSTGGAVLLNYLWRYERERVLPHFERIALCAPLVLPRAWARGRILYALVHRFIKRLARGSSHSSHDLTFTHFVDEQDCLQSRTLSVRWVGAMKAWDAQFREFPPLHHTLLVVQGDEDMTVDWRYNLKQIQRALPNAQFALIPGAGHQLVNEVGVLRAQVFSAIAYYFANP
ncbi:alpha/beta hydrolase [Cellvibrio sp. NN19]|uniref:alpha/beta hydrolase n=1 Tax=Cellvibrio chitinivorans TaxID=3102792 RepID=UPI002B41257A|nr:alpha/beta hydrolase [Cellvibrio sp. NN19]